MRTALILWTLMGLFCLRVLGQVLVEFLHVGFLPPSEEWFSGLLPYPPLLASQLLIIALMTKIGLDFTRRSGWTYRPRRLAGSLLLAFGGVYLAVMIIRYVVRMTLYPHERWAGGSIPIFFHWVLAAYVLVLGAHHWRQGVRPPAAGPRAALRRWAPRLAWLAGGGLVTAAVALWVVYLLLPSLLARQLGIRPAEYAVRIERGVRLTTSDGVPLVADVYHPQRAGPKTPTVLVRLPYSRTLTNKTFATVVGRLWAERGYTVVIQGTRGRYESGGTYYPLRDERRDGVETLQWLARQPWYDGRLGMWGGSYFGYTQWVLADCTDPGPTALFIQEASTDFHGMFYPGGAFSLKSALHWAVMSHGPRDVTPSPEALARGFGGFPLVEADDRAAGDIAFFDDWVLHPDRDDYWAQIDGSDRAGRLRAPALLMAGWYDPFLPTQLNDFARIRREADPRVAAETRLVIGPWAHAETVRFPDGSVPRNYRLECLAPSVAWFDRHLLGAAGLPAAPVRIYTMGTHRWRDEQEWPPARARPTPCYLHSGGKANTSAGDGALTWDPPASRETPDTFVYDPRDPVPTAGGAMLGFNAGIERQDAVESRADVLVYTTGPLDEDLEVTGPVELVLHVSTSAPNTDFTGKLVDVYPDGSAYNVSDGILRRRYEPGAGEGAEIKIDLWPTSTVFLKGHRLRLEVSSSNYPRFDRNPNTGRPAATETQPVAATQTIYHGPHTPSRLILSVVRKDPSS
jgi:uncharacterized protein